MITDYVEDWQQRKWEWIERKQITFETSKACIQMNASCVCVCEYATRLEFETHTEVKCSLKAWTKNWFPTRSSEKEVQGACIKEPNRSSVQTCSVKHCYLQDDRCKTKQNPVAVEFDEVQRRKNKRVTTLPVKRNNI